MATVQEFVDLVVTMNNGVKFAKHIAKVAVKRPRTANLITYKYTNSCRPTVGFTMNDGLIIEAYR